MAAGFFVEWGKGEDRLAVGGAVACCDGMVLAFDVEHHHGVRPVQQVRNHHPHSFATAGGGGQHDGELAGQGQELASEAADQNARGIGVLVGQQQSGALDFSG